MKRLVAACLLLLIPLPAGAVEGDQVRYAGGTVSGLEEGVLGRLDLASETSLTFEGPRTKLAIPYAKMDAYEYSQRVAHHLGVLPAIAVGLVKKRQRKHFFRIAFHDEGNTPQVALFEVPKQMPQTLLAILLARAPRTCKRQTLVD